MGEEPESGSLRGRQNNVSVRLTILFGFLFRHFQWVFSEGRLNRSEGV